MSERDKAEKRASEIAAAATRIARQMGARYVSDDGKRASYVSRSASRNSRTKEEAA